MSQSTPPAEKKETPDRLKINGPRLITGTLAAVTGAALSSRLGVTGTLVGTAVISLVSGTMATVYEHSVERGRAAMRSRMAALEEASPLHQHRTDLRDTEATRRIAALGEQIRHANPGRTLRTQPPPTGDSTIPYRAASADATVPTASGDKTVRHPAASGDATVRHQAAAGDKTVAYRPTGGDQNIPHPRVPGDETIPYRTAPGADETVMLGSTTRQPAPSGKPSWPALILDRLRQVPRRRWLLAGAGTLATFVLAIGIVTAIEVAHGSSLSGSSHSTTLGGAFGGSSSHHTPQQHPKNPQHSTPVNPKQSPVKPSPTQPTLTTVAPSQPSTTPSPSGPSQKPTATATRPQNSPSNSAPPTQTHSAPTQPTQTPSASQQPSPSNVPTPRATPSG